MINVSLCGNTTINNVFMPRNGAAISLIKHSTAIWGYYYWPLQNNVWLIVKLICLVMHVITCCTATTSTTYLSALLRYLRLQCKKKTETQISMNWQEKCSHVVKYTKVWMNVIGSLLVYTLEQTVMARALCSKANEHGAITDALASSHRHIPSRANSDGSSS